MSVLHRILAGIEFSVALTSDEILWPSQTEDLLRLANELREIVRGQLALAAVATPPDNCDCADIDRWMQNAESSLGKLWKSVTGGFGTAEMGAWFGPRLSEWCHSARDSEMDLLLIPQQAGPDQLPEICRQANCPVWIMGTEHGHQLGSEPPLIAFVDDLSPATENYHSVAVQLAHAWNARLLIVHPLPHAVSDLTEQQNDELRRQVFIRLSRTDYRSLHGGSQFHYLEHIKKNSDERMRSGNSDTESDRDRVLKNALEFHDQRLFLGEITDQVPNLVMAPAQWATNPPPRFGGHLLVW